MQTFPSVWSCWAAARTESFRSPLKTFESLHIWNCHPPLCRLLRYIISPSSYWNHHVVQNSLLNLFWEPHTNNYWQNRAHVKWFKVDAIFSVLFGSLFSRCRKRLRCGAAERSSSRCCLAETALQTLKLSAFSLSLNGDRKRTFYSLVSVYLFILHCLGNFLRNKRIQGQAEPLEDVVVLKWNNI